MRGKARRGRSRYFEFQGNGREEKGILSFRAYVYYCSRVNDRGRQRRQKNRRPQDRTGQDRGKTKTTRQDRTGQDRTGERQKTKTTGQDRGKTEKTARAITKAKL
jgi:hypothetical protein